MKITLSRMIVPVPLILGLGLTACTVMTKEEHVEMHKEIHKDMMTIEAHKKMMQKMKTEMMKKEMMKKEKMK